MTTKERKGLTQAEFQKMLNEAAENAVDKHFSATNTNINTPANDYVKALGLDGSDAEKAKENIPGWRFATLVKTIVATGNDYNAVRQVAAELGDGNAIKAMQAGDLTAGGAFIGGDIADEFIELLRPASAVRAMDPQTMELPKGVKDLPVFTGSATAAYVSEGASVTCLMCPLDHLRWCSCSRRSRSSVIPPWTILLPTLKWYLYVSRFFPMRKTLLSEPLFPNTDGACHT